MKTSAVLAAFAVLLVLPARADAQHMTLHMANGLVTLDAQNVPVRQILAEWARVGGTRIVNGEKVMGAPVTLQLDGIPERQALETILRGVSGYMLGSRQAGSAGVSAFDRILILPTSSAPRSNPAPTNTAAFSSRPVMPAQPPQPVETEPIEDEDNEEPGDGDPSVEGEEDEEVVEALDPQRNPNLQRRPPFPNPLGAPRQPFAPQGVIPGPPPQNEDGDEDGPAAQQPPMTPFNVPPGASSVPGVIATPPQDTQQPGTRPRRPPQ